MEQPPPVSPCHKYTEAGSAWRHYSAVRVSIISIGVPVLVGIGGVMIFNPKNTPLVAFLLVSELFSFICLVGLSLYLSSHMYLLRECLIKLEHGQDASPHTVLSGIRFVRQYDAFDRAFIALGVVFHLGLYASLAVSIFAR